MSRHNDPQSTSGTHAILSGFLGSRVRNIRVGFATNSSSLHALAVWTDGPQPDKHGLQFYPTEDSLFFGEQSFRLQSEVQKRAYMAAALAGVGEFSRSPYGVAREKNWRLPRNQQKSMEEVMDGCRAEQAAWLDEHEALLEKATGFRCPKGDLDGQMGVDNHSDIEPPRSIDPTTGAMTVHLGFYRALTDVIARDPNVVIVGGHDNRGNGNPFDNGVEEGTTRIGYRFSDAIPRGFARFDQDLGCWVVFDPWSGFKVHLDLSLPLEESATAPSAFATGDGADSYPMMETPGAVVDAQPWRVRCAVAGAVPELLDVSITDYCAAGCPFCYRGSTEAGSHASMDYLRRLALACGEAGVFEVAIGGGEPTEHPGFVEILTAFRSAGVVPNFTTRNVDYLVRMADAKVQRGAWFDVRSSRAYAVSTDEGGEDPGTVPFADLFGAVAVSVDSPAEAAEVIDRLRPAYGRGFMLGRSKFVLQYIVGQSARQSDLEGILRAAAKADVPVTLLGFKHTERGATYGDRSTATRDGEEPWWVRVIDELRGELRRGFYEGDPVGGWDGADLRVGIDTVLAMQGGEHLLKRGLDPRCIVPVEGVCSAFVNAVSQTAHTSSYDRSMGHRLALGGSTDVDALLEAWCIVRNGGSGHAPQTSAGRSDPSRVSLPVLRDVGSP